MKDEVAKPMEITFPRPITRAEMDKSEDRTFTLVLVVSSWKDSSAYVVWARAVCRNEEEFRMDVPDALALLGMASVLRLAIGGSVVRS